MGRRDELAEQATDYVLEAGLIGLSLRPLAAAIGTSDRMLNYHFGSTDELVASVLGVSNGRSAAQIQALKPAATVREAVLALWAALTGMEQQRCQRMYVEAAALGLLGREPYASAVRQANGVWLRALRDFLVASGAPADRSKRLVTLLDSAFMGFQLDLPLDESDADISQAVQDLADAIESLATR
ncbi:MAG: TetR/AcrR family transcriptional regulator [Aeromicrobium sp.]